MWWGKFYEGLEEDWTYRPYMLNSGAEKARGSSGKRLESGFTARPVGAQTQITTLVRRPGHRAGKRLGAN